MSKQINVLSATANFGGFVLMAQKQILVLKNASKTKLQKFKNACRTSVADIVINFKKDFFETIELALNHYSNLTAQQFKADVFSFIGGIKPEYLSSFRAHMESLANRDDKSENLVFVLYTPGGVAEIVEKMVDITRHHYKEVWFVVPDMAMSAE
jgi:membrane-bound ClpP family serine protease